MEERIQGILRKLPGYTGYEAKEHRRDADKLLRMQVAKQFRDQQGTLDRLIQDMVSNGNIQHTDQLDRVSKGIDRFVVKLETAPRGYAGWFEVIKIDETDLDLLYQFDLKLAEGAALLGERISFVRSQMNEQGDLGDAIAQLQSFVDDLNRQLDAREAFTAEGKRPEAPPMAGYASSGMMGMPAASTAASDDLPPPASPANDMPAAAPIPADPDTTPTTGETVVLPDPTDNPPSA